MNRESITLHAGTVLTPGEAFSPGWVTVEADRFEGFGSGAGPSQGRHVDLGRRILVPGFVDVHVHGGDGAEVNAGTAEDVAVAVRHLAAFHCRHGTTSLLATTMSDTPERLAAALRGIGRCAREGPTGGARVLGAHLEGPWLALERAGAQDRERLHPPHSTEVEALLEADPGVLRMVTLAPELDGGLDAVRRLSAAGVLVSLGHSAADYDEARAAFDAGASHVTHIFDAMPAIRHRRPGPVVAALADSRVTVEVIADGVHVHPAMLALVARGAAGGIVAVTDAVAAAGLPSGRYRLGRSSVDVADDRVVLTDAPDTLAGSVLTMDRAVATLVAAGLSLPDAVTAATVRPASAMGDASRGRIAIGAAADLVVLEPDLSCAATVVGGRVVHDPSGIFAGRGSTHAQDEHSPAEIAAAIPQV